MLNPDNRHLLLEALRPPNGMQLTAAVGTTFTLDLDALLLAPVAMALHTQRADGSSDPLARLESVRRHADDITLFCQAGAIKVPGRLQPIVTYLEDSVIPINMPDGRLFHPKIWVLGFSDGDDVATRFLCLSRNLTFDNSWDTIVQLDGVHGRRRASNRPLADFLRSLPAIGVSEALSSDRADQINDLAEQVMHTDWELPEGFQEVNFWPMGQARQPAPDLTGDRILAISPFLSEEVVRDLSEGCRRATLVSRPESIDAVGGSALAGFEKVLILDADIPPDGSGSDDDDAAGADVTAESRPYFGLTGVHAKAYLVEKGAWAWFFTGSTNATDAGFKRNIEFLVELTGYRRHVGIDVAVEEQGHKACLRDLLVEHLPNQNDPPEPDEVSQAQYRLDVIVREVAALPFTTTVEPAGDDYRVRITTTSGAEFDPADGRVHLRAAASGVAGLHEIVPDVPVEVDLGETTLQGISAFIVIEASKSVAGTNVTARALVKTALSGIDPEERKGRVLSQQLENPDDLIRYLLFLLYDLDDQEAADAVVASLGSGGSWNIGHASVPLLEAMLAALARGATDSLERVGELLSDLQSTPEGAELIPDGLIRTWESIDEVRQESP